MSDSIRNISRRDLTAPSAASGNWAFEAVNAGSLARIADATEKMSVRYDQLVEDRDRYKRWYDDERARNKKLRNRVAGLQGAFGRIKKKLSR